MSHESHNSTRGMNTPKDITIHSSKSSSILKPLPFIFRYNANLMTTTTQVYLQEPVSPNEIVKHTFGPRNGKPILEYYLINDSTTDTHLPGFVLLRSKEGRDGTTSHTMTTKTLR